MPASVTQLDPQAAADKLLQVVSALYAELHQAQSQSSVVDLDSELERDLGLDSLARVELLSRAGQQFGVHLPEASLGAVETVADLLRAIQSAGNRVTRPGPSSAEPIHSPRPPLDAPAKAVTLNEVLEWHVQEHADTTHAVLLVEQQPRRLTYLELRDGARAIAGSLQQAGVQPGATIALMLPTAVEYLCAFFGVLLAGAIPVPIYPPTRLSQLEEHVRRHAEILKNADAVALITALLVLMPPTTFLARPERWLRVQITTTE